MRAIVLGAGVIGAAIADALASRGVEVVVLDMRSPARGASHASAGILAPFTEAHQGSPLLALGRRSLELYEPFLRRTQERAGRPVTWARTGTLEIALDAADVSRLQSVSSWLGTEGVAHTWLGHTDVRAFEACVTSSARGGLFVPDHAFVDVRGLVAALVHAARLSGAVFEDAVTASAVDTTPGEVCLRTDRGDYAADWLVIAAGSWTGRLRGILRVPVRPVRGQLLHLRWSSPVRPARVVWGPRCYTVPWPDGSLLVGATVEDVGFDETSTVSGVHELLGAVGELLPAARTAELEAVRVGLRPAIDDGLPAIGPVATAPRVVMATGHYRNGVLLAPLTAHLVERLVVDGVADPALAVTTPDRFAG
jgi:glycine oxidase